jgi:hypothetical protein
MNSLDQLSLVWQVWAAMLLGAVLLMLGLFIGIEWRWICASTRSAWTSAVALARDLFTDAAIEADERPRLRRPDADELLINMRAGERVEPNRQFPQRFRVQPTPHTDDALRRRQLLALAESSPFRKTVH